MKVGHLITMKNGSKFVMLGLVTLLSCAPAYAAATKATDTNSEDRPTAARSDREAVILTMERAIAVALQDNLTVLSAKQGVESAKGSSKAASSALLPYITLGGEHNVYDEVTSYPDHETLARIALAYTVYNGGSSQAQSKAGKIGIKQAQEQLRDTGEGIALTVWNAYCNVLYSQEVCRNTRSALDYYTNYQKELEQRVIHGLSTNLDLTRAKQQRENARADDISASNNLESARIELCRLLRLSPETPIELLGSLEDRLPLLEDVRNVPEDIEGTVSQILDARADYVSLKHAVDIQKQQVTVAKSGMLPTLAVSTGYRFAYDWQGIDSSDDNQWTASITLDIPLYDGGATSGNVRAAKANLQTAKNNLQAQEETIRAELADTWLTLQNSLESAIAARSNVSLAEDSLRYAENGYREGVNTQLDVLDARNELTAANLLLAQNLNACRVAQANCWKAQGIMIPEALQLTQEEAEAMQKKMNDVIIDARANSK